MKRMQKRNRKAFTLIEVLLVTGILALLAAFAVPALMRSADKAKNDACKSQIGPSSSLANALETYYMDVGSYPDSDEGLAALYQKKDDVEDESYAGPYMKGSYTQLKDPWGSEFGYRSPGEFNEDTYDLWSFGKDKEDDEGKEGSDDIKNWEET